MCCSHNDKSPLRTALGHQGPFRERYASTLPVLFDKNAMDHVPKIALRPQVVEELRVIFAAKNSQNAELLLRRMVESYAKSAPLLATWLETNIPECLNCCELSKAHQTRMRTTNMVERVNQERKRRTHVIRIFPNVDSRMRVHHRPIE